MSDSRGTKKASVAYLSPKTCGS